MWHLVAIVDRQRGVGYHSLDFQRTKQFVDNGFITAEEQTSKNPHSAADYVLSTLVRNNTKLIQLNGQDMGTKMPKPS